MRRITKTVPVQIILDYPESAIHSIGNIGLR